MTTSTPTPWEIENRAEGQHGKGWKAIVSGHREVVSVGYFERHVYGEIECHHGVYISEDDAELIVRAVNAHEALLTAAKAAAEELDTLIQCTYSSAAAEEIINSSTTRVYNELRAAIALAEGTR